ncbi:DUF7503 family protein [Halocatena marina]|uniref:Uncharacterized protein n=1 Tax=Halocatena marina TaxID=2934937 RepID=A0ABD5YHY5_9EURY|nr:hypothetical protein [Halocatena marina]
MSEHTTLTAYLNDHPKMTGVLFTMLLLLTQVGAASAANKIYYSGP